jgi:hypothetical protein
VVHQGGGSAAGRFGLAVGDEAGQADGMSRVLLRVGEKEAEVVAWLGELAGGGRPQWGGILRAVPTGLAAALHQGDDVWIRLLPGGEERRIRPGVSKIWDKERDDQERDEVLFLGEGTFPSDQT